MWSDYPDKCPICKTNELLLHVDNGSSEITYNLIDGYIDEESEDMNPTETEEPEEFITCLKCDKRVYQEVKTWEKTDN